MLDLAQDRRRRSGPDERPWVFVVFPHVRANRGDEGRDTAEGAAADAFARDLSEEAFDEVQPRGSRRGEVEVKPWVLAHPRLHGRVRVRAVVVEDEMDVLLAGGLAIDLVQEGEELGMRMAGVAGVDHVALQDIEGGKQRRRPVPCVVMRLPGRQPRPQGQHRLGPIQGLDLALFVNAQDQRLRGRVQVEADHVPQLADEVRVAVLLCP